MPGIEVRRRTSGHRLEPTTTVLRFYVADVNRVITNAAANATRYSDLVSDRPAGWEVLALSCFAITDQWTPERLAEGTSFAEYLEVSAHAVIEAGYELWGSSDLSGV